MKKVYSLHRAFRTLWSDGSTGRRDVAAAVRGLMLFRLAQNPEEVESGMERVFV